MSSLLKDVASMYPRLGLEAFCRRFDEYEKTATKITKLEVLQTFHEPQSESYLKFMAADKAAAIELLPAERLAEKETHLSLIRRGAVFERLRLVRRPLSRYLEWEFESYKVSARWGERIGIVDITDEKISEQFKDAVDFILFDNEKLLVNWYSEEGVFCGGWDVEDIRLVTCCRKLADDARSVCVPLAQFEWENKL